MKVHFVGAGPGAADLITVRGAKLLGRAGMVLYAGSLVCRDLLSYCKEDALTVDSSGLDLESQMKLYRRALSEDQDVVRLHSGDPSIYGATAEQIRRLQALGIDYEIVPGVSTFCSSAASLGVELTKPGVSQTVIITRTAGRASPMPPAESLDQLAAHGATMAVFLSGANLRQTIETLGRHYSADTPVALVHKNEWPAERRYTGTLASILSELDFEQWKLSTMLLVGQVLTPGSGQESRLYAADYKHLHRQ